MQGYGPASYGDGFADVYDDWYGGVTDVVGTVELVAALAPGGTVCELGVGTGRIAMPLVERGLRVTGVDASAAMLDRLRAKPGGEAVTTVELDFGVELPDGPFDVVLATYNTFFNLVDDAAQRRCLAMVAERLRPGGRLVLETFVPRIDDLGPVDDVAVRTVTSDAVILSVSRRDDEAQRIDGHMVELVDGATVKLRPWSVRWMTPEQLDAAAGAVGLDFETAFGDWRGTEYQADGPVRVSVYRRPGIL